MRISVFLLTLLAISGCYRTDSPADDDPDAGLPGTSPADERCGETTLTAYLVPSMACPVQSTPELPDEQSGEDLACRLDVYASEAAPDPMMPEACGEPPFTSLCFLDRVGMSDDVLDAFEGAPRVALEGYMREMTVCEHTEKGSANQECREQEVFYPCAAEPGTDLPQNVESLD